MFIVQYYGSEVMPPYPGSCFDVLSEPHGDWIVYSRHTDIKKAAWRYHRLNARPDSACWFGVEHGRFGFCISGLQHRIRIDQASVRDERR